MENLNHERQVFERKLVKAIKREEKGKEIIDLKES